MGKIKGILFIILLLPSFCLGYELKCRVLRTIDGDTVLVRNLRTKKRLKIRVVGIDTPEKYNSKKMLKDCKKCGVDFYYMKYLGSLSTSYACSLLRHHIVRVKIIGKGYYGRYLGYIYIKGKDFGAMMIKSGYACRYKYSKNRKYKRLEKWAKKNNKGLWTIDKKIMNCLCN